MKKLLICPKQSGNTYKVCSYVSEHSDVEWNILPHVNYEELSQYDAIILTSGVYGGTVHKNLVNWLKNFDSSTMNPNAKVYLLLTWLGRGKSDMDSFHLVEKLLVEKDIKLENNYMQCFARSFLIFKYSHPNEEDYKNVLAWVKEI